MVIKPQTRVRLYSNVDVDPNYQNALYFESAGEQSSYFAEHLKYEFNDFQYVEATGAIRVPVNKEKERILNNNRKLISMAKEWGIQWKKDNPDKDSNVWEGTPYSRTLVVNPSAVEYYKNKLAELNWKEDEDYSYSSQIESYENFVRAIN